MFLKRRWSYILCKRLSIPCTLHTSTTKSMRLPEYGLFRFDAVGNMDDNDTINALSLCACVFVLDLELLQSDLRAWQCWHSPSERTLDYNEFDLWSRPMALLYSVLFCLKEVKILVTLCFLLILLFFVVVGHWLGGDIEFVHWILVSVAMVVHKRWSHFSFVRIEMDFGICQYSVYLRHAMITIKDVVNIRLIRMLCDIAFHLNRNH